MIHILKVLEKDMENKLYLKDEELEELFKFKIIQQDNFNSNSDLFKYGNTIFKIYNGNNTLDIFNKSVINNIFNKYNYLSNIKELVLPKKLLIYNNHIVGFSMPYIEGNSLEEIINNNKDYNMKDIFIKLLNVINTYKELPFEFFIGDMHEKNIIIDNNNNIKIIDPDSFIIDNNKLCIDNEYLVGKYPNHYFNNNELKRINYSSDYYSLLCIILNYLFKNIIEDTSNPITWLKEEQQFKEIHEYLYKINEHFILKEEDINNLFEFKNKLNYKYIENQEVKKEIQKIRKVLKKH